MKDDHYILLTIDVEDWFQVENFKQCIHFSSWPSCELRVERNTHRLLDLLDSVRVSRSSRPGNSANPLDPTHPTATFFILGWIAERLPHLVREIHDRGHEIASHGCNHTLCTECSSNDLKKDLIYSKKLLEDIIGHRVYGYRAPSFAINNDILEIVRDCGYLYDSSYNSFSLHGRYGKLSMNGYQKKGIALPINPGYFYELPISNFKFGDIILPWGGGGYFRLFPIVLFRTGVRKILKKENAFLFYLHPWEVDSEQPKVKDAKRIYKFRHYVNLKKTKTKLIKLVREFEHCQFVTCHNYLKHYIINHE